MFENKLLEIAFKPKSNKLNGVFKNKNNLMVHTRKLVIFLVIKENVRLE
jgi:hypothetical protein